MHLGGRPDQLDAEGLALIAEALALYKRHRAFLRQALPFWPLGLPKPGDNVYAAGLRHGNKSLIAVWNLGDNGVDLSGLFSSLGDARICFPASAEGLQIPAGPRAPLFSLTR